MKIETAVSPSHAFEHVSARQCERLIALACSGQRPTDGSHESSGFADDGRSARAQRDSLTEAMIGLILPDAF